MNVLTASQMNELDRRTIEEGTPGIDLMRAAGDAVCELVLDLIGPDETVSVVCGKGNNGGDGFRIAERLADGGVPVTVLLAGTAVNVRGDASTCLNAYRKTGHPLIEIGDETALAAHAEVIGDADVVVDALFGTGISGEVMGLPGALIDVINRSRSTVIAVDIPSGVDASTGRHGERTVMAHRTVTFGCLKVGQVVKPGALMCGIVHIADIGFSPAVLASIEPYARTLVAPEAAKLMPRRPFDAHKFGVGTVFVLAGSVGMTGAAALTSMAALRSGAGMVSLGCPESLNDILEVKLTEVMTRPLPEVRQKRCLSLRGLGMLRQMSATADVLAIGPGLGGYGETAELIRRFVAGYAGRIVLDADGLNAFTGRAAHLAESRAEIVITPHYGELSRLMGMPSATIADDPRGAALDTARITGAVVLLKGSPTIVATPSGDVWLNGTGNEGMATAGAGDVLTGMIAGLAAQGLSLTEAAVLSAYLHGRAGDMAADDLTVHGMAAGDIVEHIPPAIGELGDDGE